MDKEKLVKYVANLARINLDDAQGQSLGNQLVSILDYIDKLKEVDVDGVEPMRGLHADHNVFRQDEVSTEIAIGDRTREQ